MSGDFETDIDGVTYTKGYKTLYSAINKETVEIDSRCTNIFGENEFTYAFKNSAETLISFSFEANSQLVSIDSYAFYSCSNLQKVDLSQCSYLESIGSYSFSSCSSVTEIKFPSSLISLGDYCFTKLPLVSILQLPKSIQSIGSACFAITGITSVEFENEIQISIIPWRSFAECKFTRFTIPSNVTTFVPSSLEQTPIEVIEVATGNQHYHIQNQIVISNDFKSLYYCPSTFNNVTIPENITTIIDSAFSYSNIPTLILPQTLITIQSYSFSCAALTVLTIPASVRSIQRNAFSSCLKLEYVYFEEPSNLTKLPQYLFDKCEMLKRIEIPDSVTTIENNCFSNTKSLEYVKLPSNLSVLGGGVFSETSPTINITFGEGSQYVFDKDLFLITSYDKKSLVQFLSDSITDVIIPSETLYILQSAFKLKTQLKTIIFDENSKLERIETSAFDYCTGLTTIYHLPETITSIGTYSFCACYCLQEISLPNIEIIPDSAFHSCISLSKVSFNKIQIIEENAFAVCRNLSDVNLGQMLLSIGSYAFQETEKLEMIVLPQTLINISDHSFYLSGIKTVKFSLDSSTSIKLSEDQLMTKLNQRAFYYAKSLNSIENFPSSIIELGNECFSYTNFTNFTFPENIISIGDYCFAFCSSLKSFNISETSNLQNISNHAFRGCSSLKEIYANNPYFRTENSALLNYPNRDKVIIYPPASLNEIFSFPSEVQSIDWSAFYGCVNLKIIVFPDDSKLTTIGDNAFENCKNLNIINIPPSLQYIGKDAFLGCNKIKCGQLIKISGSTLDQLIEKGKFPNNAIKECSNTINCKTQVFHPSLAFIFIALQSF